MFKNSYNNKHFNFLWKMLEPLFKILNFLLFDVNFKTYINNLILLMYKILKKIILIKLKFKIN